MTRKHLAATAALAVGALALGAVFGTPGSGWAADSAAPGNTAVPVITGTLQQGETLTASTGTWTGSPASYAYAWSRCDQTGNACAAVAGATATTYTAGPGDVDHTLRVAVTATGTGGSASATSAPSPVVSSPAAPKNTALPTISGSQQVGSTLTASTGAWGNASTYAFAWSRCDGNGNGCSAIADVTNSTYKLAQADLGATLRVAVTATNNSGSTTTYSALTAPVSVTLANGCPSGTGAIPIAELKPPARLSIDRWSITPKVVTRSAAAIQLQFRITACNGRPVQGAVVFATAIPYNQFHVVQGITAADGTVTLTESRLSGFPARPRVQHLLAVLVRASKPGEPLLAGVSTRRVVSFPVSLG